MRSLRHVWSVQAAPQRTEPTDPVEDPKSVSRRVRNDRCAARGHPHCQPTKGFLTYRVNLEAVSRGEGSDVLPGCPAVDHRSVLHDRAGQVGGQRADQAVPAPVQRDPVLVVEITSRTRGTPARHPGNRTLRAAALPCSAAEVQCSARCARRAAAHPCVFPVCRSLRTSGRQDLDRADLTPGFGSLKVCALPAGRVVGDIPEGLVRPDPLTTTSGSSARCGIVYLVEGGRGPSRPSSSWSADGRTRPEPLGGGPEFVGTHRDGDGECLKVCHAGSR